MTSLRTRQVSVVSASTFAFTICFAVWMIFAVIGIPIKKSPGLNETQFGRLSVDPARDDQRDPLAHAAARFDADQRGRGGRVIHSDRMVLA